MHYRFYEFLGKYKLKYSLKFGFQQLQNMQVPGPFSSSRHKVKKIYLKKKYLTILYYTILISYYPWKTSYILERSLISHITQALGALWKVFYAFLKNLVAAWATFQPQGWKNQKAYHEKIYYIFLSKTFSRNLGWLLIRL